MSDTGTRQLIDDAMLEKAWREHYEAIFAYVRRLVRSDEDSENIASQTFLRLLACGTQVRNVKAFLYRIARNLVYDHYKKRQPQSVNQSNDTDDPDASISLIESIADRKANPEQLLVKAAVTKAQTEILESYLTKSIQEWQATIWRMRKDKRTWEEIAEVVKMNKHKVKDDYNNINTNLKAHVRKTYKQWLHLG